ncbi:hypothetical protein TWF718_009693 [Orbilia javanica]|uniref:Uncharacterized protein n=1 Tax=Orbilia javanica TaxID=47235 RepID=A0AAN8MMX3_9PEZI
MKPTEAQSPHPKSPKSTFHHLWSKISNLPPHLLHKIVSFLYEISNLDSINEYAMIFESGGYSHITHQLYSMLLQDLENSKLDENMYRFAGDLDNKIPINISGAIACLQPNYYARPVAKEVASSLVDVVTTVYLTIKSELPVSKLISPIPSSAVTRLYLNLQIPSHGLSIISTTFATFPNLKVFQWPDSGPIIEARAYRLENIELPKSLRVLELSYNTFESTSEFLEYESLRVRALFPRVPIKEDDINGVLQEWSRQLHLLFIRIYIGEYIDTTTAEEISDVNDKVRGHGADYRITFLSGYAKPLIEQVSMVDRR